MFIELTEYLRCPSGHGDEYLVLTPDEMSNRHVKAGTLGCPVCKRSFAVEDGVARFGTPGPSDVVVMPDAAVIQALLDLQSPGGYIGLVAGATQLAPALGDLLPDVHMVLINAQAPGGDHGSCIENDTSVPLRSGVLRGVVVGSGQRVAPPEEAARVVLRGRRVIFAGETGPMPNDLQVLASENGLTVTEKR